MIWVLKGNKSPTQSDVTCVSVPARWWNVSDLQILKQDRFRLYQRTFILNYYFDPDLIAASWQ